MRKIDEILRLKWEYRSGYHLIATNVGVGSSTFQRLLTRCESRRIELTAGGQFRENGALNALLYTGSKQVFERSAGKTGLGLHPPRVKAQTRHVDVALAKIYKR